MSDQKDEKDRPAQADKTDKPADLKNNAAVRFAQYTSPAMLAMLLSTKAASAS